MSKNHQNYTVGIKLPWTLNSEENWNRTHRMAGKLWILAGLVFWGSVFFENKHGTNCDHSRCCDDPDDLFVCTL